MLPYAMPILEERLVKEEASERPESCEEVRLQLIDVRHLPTSCSRAQQFMKSLSLE